MLNLKEDILQFIWQHKLLKPLPLITTSGKQIQILKPGELNKDSGPDFFNAQIKINELILAGNVEVHVKTGDWLKHNHQQDKTYDNLILHVVYEDDKPIRQNKDNNVEVLEIKNLVPENLLQNYGSLIESKSSLPCEPQLADISDLKFSSWLQRMLIERLEYKVKNMETIFQNVSGNYTQTFYTILLRNFGFKVNSVPFELLAKHLPVNTLLKHADNLLSLEALLLGSAGMLEDQFTNKHALALQNEFEYLKNKYTIIPLKKELFKFSKLRPANFAPLRLAQFAHLIFLHPELFQSPQNFNSFKKIESCLDFQLTGYWKNHYTLDGLATFSDLRLGHDSISNIITNTFAPFFFFYFQKTAASNYGQIPLLLLEASVFEKNAKTKLFSGKKHLFKSAADSQALINLHDNFCARRGCLNCGVAAAILKSH
ncbi:MAG: DUF2851 family protein [Bacteroidetes bacterium]|nr:DUF2851 family protein [Bacteroidota bacterium]